MRTTTPATRSTVAIACARLCRRRESGGATIWGGLQTFEPFTPKGGRFIEVHVLCPEDKLSWNSVAYTERGYHERTEAQLSLGDELLERIWSIGVETLRGCAEDALIDNPTRERGQWVGDVVSVGLGITSVAYNDLSLCRRGLQHSAEGSREDGLIAGMSPGGCVYLPTYSLLWTTASVEYYRHSRDADYLRDFWDAAKKNFEAILAFETPKGLGDVAGWNFVDWGYLPTPGGVDLACNLHFFEALRSMVIRGGIIEVDMNLYEEKATGSEANLRAWLRELEKEGGVEAIGYHSLTLAMRLGLFEGDCAAAIDLLKQHWASGGSCSIKSRVAGVGCCRMTEPLGWKFSIPAGAIATSGREHPLGFCRAMYWDCSHATIGGWAVSI